LNVPPFYTTFLSVISAIEAEICKKIVIIRQDIQDAFYIQRHNLPIP